MTKKTHLTGGALAGAGLALGAGLEPLGAALVIAGSLGCAMVPDWDRALDKGPDHRSLTHSLIFAGGFAVLAAVLAVAAFGFAGSGGGPRGEEPPLSGLISGDPSPLAPLLGAFAVGGAAGYVSHLLLDSLTGKRIWLLLPGGPRFGLPVFTTGGLGEALLLMVLLALLGWAVFALLTGGSGLPGGITDGITSGPAGVGAPGGPLPSGRPR